MRGGGCIYCRGGCGRDDGMSAHDGCSGIVVNGGCSHGHAFTMACYGHRGTPTCMREDLLFDEERQAVTIETWPITRREIRNAKMAMTKMGAMMV